MNRAILAATAALSVMAFGATANAASVVNGDGTVTLDKTDPFSWTVVTNPTQGDDFSGFEESTIVYAFTGANAAGTIWNFTYSLDNTSTGAGADASVAVFGFDASGSPTMTVGGGDEFQLGSGGNFNGLGNRDFCLLSGSNCNGGGNSGVYESETPALGSFALTYSLGQSAITLENFATRFQRTGPDEEGSASGFGSAIPEPATWAMMIGGFGLVGAAMRRRQRVSVTYA